MHVSGVEAQEVLGDLQWEVPEAVSGEGEFLMFRAAVSRFSNGSVHAERRAILDQLIAGLEVDELRAAAANLAAELAGAGVEPDAIALTVPTSVLGAALGMNAPSRLPELVEILAGPYASGVAGDEPVDQAVVSLRALVPHEHQDRAELVLQLLIQAHAATAGLIRAACADTEGSAESRVDRVLRERPPVTATRRVATEERTLPGGVMVEAGATVTVSLADDETQDHLGKAASMPFGHGPRSCPSAEVAKALAVGAVSALHGDAVEVAR